MGKRIQQVQLQSLGSETLYLGYVGENEHTQIVVNCAIIFTDYPDATASIVVRPPAGDLYHATITRNANRLIWEITSSDVIRAGSGQAQFTFENDGEVIRSIIARTRIDPSIEATGEAPEPLQNWMDQADAKAAEIAQDAARQAAVDVVEEAEAEIERVAGTIPADYTELSDDVDELKSALDNTAHIVEGDRYSLKGSADYEFAIAIPNGSKIIITNNRNVACSAQLRNDNGDILQNLGTITANGGTITRTVNVDGVTKFTGYCSGGYDGLLFVENNESLTNLVQTNINDIKTIQDNDINITSVDTITETYFRNGSIVNGKYDEYMKASRASTGILLLLNDVDIKRSDNSPAESRIYVTTMNGIGEYVSGSGWLTSVHLSAGSIVMLTLSLNPNSSTETSLSDIINGFVFSATEPANYDDITKYIVDGTYRNTLFQRGTSAQGVVSDFARRSRFCTKAIMKSPHDIIVYNNDAGILDICFYDEEKNMVQSLSWRKNDVYIPANIYFTMNLTPNQNNDRAYTDAEIWGLFDVETANIGALSMNPNVIIQCRNVDDTRFPPYTKYYIQAASHNQYDRVRVNVRVTTDGYFVLIHDDTINSEARNSDGTTITNSITSSGQSLETLNSYDWGIKYGAKYAGLNVPQLEDACKYAALYNMGLTIELSDISSNESGTWQEHVDTMMRLFEKYGLVENLIIITSTGFSWSVMEYWKQKSPYISYFVGGTVENILTWKTNIDSLMTGKNTIYIMPFPWGGVPDEQLRTFCAVNGYRLYNSSAMSKDQFYNLVGFNTGNTLIEPNNVYMVKSIIKRHADKILLESDSV